jgi:hypothetical protein
LQLFLDIFQRKTVLENLIYIILIKAHMLKYNQPKHKGKTSQMVFSLFYHCVSEDSIFLIFPL